MSVKQASTYGAIIPGFDYLTSLSRQGTISREAKKRLKWFDYYHRTRNARKTSRYFGISPQTFYRWKRKAVFLPALELFTSDSRKTAAFKQEGINIRSDCIRDENQMIS